MTIIGRLRVIFAQAVVEIATVVIRIILSIRLRVRIGLMAGSDTLWIRSAVYLIR